MRSLITALTGLFLCLGTAEAQDINTLPEHDRARVLLGDRLQESVGALYQRETGGDFNFLCTVTAVDTIEETGEVVFLTANHCVQNSASYAITVDGLDYTTAYVHMLPGYEYDEDEYPRGHYDPEVDIALFRAMIDVPTIPIAEEGVRPSGWPIMSTGFPLGQAKASYQGQISGRLDRPGEDFHGYQSVQIFGAPGSSGTAIVDLGSAEIIAVLSSAYQRQTGTPNIYTVPVDYMRYLVLVPAHGGVALEDKEE